MFFPVLAISIMIAYTACSNDESVRIQEQSHLIKVGKEFAKIHNECLAYVYKDLTSAKTRTSLKNEMDVKQLFVSSINRYITQNTTRVISEEDAPIKLSDYNLSIDDIAKTLSEKETYYVNKALMSERTSIETLLKEVDLDTELKKENKQAVITFITTLQASSEYWEQHLGEWNELFNKPQTRASVKEVAIADAWWGYQGLMSSGLNLLVGGGAAALASACAAFLH